jgi:2',3'-cyclic-nucleotide 2'-phosphodiesterase (5'-nucleotidase family)
MRRVVGAFALAILICGFSPQPRELVIFHTNDIHGHFTAEPASWRKDHALVGGIAALSYDLDSLRKVYPHSIYLDAGDLMTGNPVCNIDYNGLKGGALPEMLYRCGIAAECLGNHEFDLGADHLRDWVKRAPYPLVCANLLDKSSASPLAAATQILNVDGLRVGVIGLILDELGSVASRRATSQFTEEDAATTAQKQIDALKGQCDFVVLLTHEGVEDDSTLATKIHGAQVIVGGHSHTRLDKPGRVNGVIIVQAGSHLKNLGILQLKIAADTVTSYDGKLIELVRPDKKITSPAALMADSLEVRIQAEYGQVIGEIGETWAKGYFDPSNVGNWICDLLKNRYKTDVAFVKGGGIRADLPAGPVTRLKIVEMLPFVNSVVMFDAKGEDLLTVALEQARAQGLHAHGCLEMSGMSVTWAKRDGKVEIRDVRIGGQPIDPTRNYRIATIDYVAQSQWGEYLKFQPKDVQATGDVISDVVTDAIRQSHSPLHADSTHRLQEIK